MSRYFAFQFRSWAYPVIVFTLAAAVWYGLPCHHLNQSLDEAGHRQAERERDLRQKAERALSGLGESDPTVVVTVLMDEVKKEVKQHTPVPDSGVIESRQATTESLDKGTDKKGYMQSKEAVNYLVATTDTKEVFLGLRETKVCCLAEVSSKNASRTAEIESALAVALGIDLKRGDRVMVIVKP